MDEKDKNKALVVEIVDAVLLDSEDQKHFREAEERHVEAAKQFLLKQKETENNG